MNNVRYLKSKWRLSNSSSCIKLSRRALTPLVSISLLSLSVWLFWLFWIFWLFWLFYRQAVNARLAERNSGTSELLRFYMKFRPNSCILRQLGCRSAAASFSSPSPEILLCLHMTIVGKNQDDWNKALDVACVRKWPKSVS